MIAGFRRVGRFTYSYHLYGAGTVSGTTFFALTRSAACRKVARWTGFDPVWERSDADALARPLRSW